MVNYDQLDSVLSYKGATAMTTAHLFAASPGRAVRRRPKGKPSRTKGFLVDFYPFTPRHASTLR